MLLGLHLYSADVLGIRSRRRGNKGILHTFEPCRHLWDVVFQLFPLESEVHEVSPGLLLELLYCADLFTKVILQHLTRVECIVKYSETTEKNNTQMIIIFCTCSLAGVSWLWLHFFSSDTLPCRVSSFCSFSTISACGCIKWEAHIVHTFSVALFCFEIQLQCYLLWHHHSILPVA